MKHLLATFIFAINLLWPMALLAQEPTDCQEYFTQNGNGLFKNGEYQKALFNYNAMQSCPDYDKSRYRSLRNKAEDCLKMKAEADEAFAAEEYSKARAKYEQLLKINPHDEEARKRMNDCKIFSSPVPENMALVPGGTITMGGKTYSSEQPVHEVTVNSFYMSKYEVTNAEFAEFLNTYGSDTLKDGAHEGELLILDDPLGLKQVDGQWEPQQGKGNHPVVYVSWYGAQAYCQWLGGRLPTEAEWEYAAHGGEEHAPSLYAGSENIDEVAWYYGNSEKQTHPVGQKAPNELGIYDMSGNVYEWVSDWYEKYTTAAQDNPKGPASGEYKVMRGGSWYDYPSHLRITNRGNYTPDYMSDLIGFRCVIAP